MSHIVGMKTHKVASYTRWLKMLSPPFNHASLCCYVWWIAGLTYSSSDLIWIVACSLKAWRHYTQICTSTRTRHTHTYIKRQKHNQILSDKHINTYLHHSTSYLGHLHQTLCSLSSPLSLSIFVSPSLQRAIVFPDSGNTRQVVHFNVSGIFFSQTGKQWAAKPAAVMTKANSGGC